MPTATAVPGKKDGSICFSPDECESGNCHNMRCCAPGKVCCRFDSQCGARQVCNNEEAYCSERTLSDAMDSEIMRQELANLRQEVLQLAEAVRENANQTVLLDRKEIEERIRHLDALVDELAEIGRNLNETTLEDVLRRRLEIQKSVDKAKDSIATKVDTLSSSEEKQLEFAEESIDSLLERISELHSEDLSEVKKNARSISGSIKQTVKAEIIEAEYQSGKKRKHTIISMTFENTAQVPIANAVLILDIPKSFATTALELHYTCKRKSGKPCPSPRVLRDDPIVAWDLEMLDAGEIVTASYTVEDEVVPDDAEQGTAVLVTNITLDPYKTVEENRDSLQPETIEQSLTTLSNEIRTIEDVEVRKRIETLADETQASLDGEDLVKAHAAVAQIRQEIEAAKTPVVTPVPTPVPTPTPTSVPPAPTPEPASSRGFAGLFVLLLIAVGIITSRKSTSKGTETVTKGVEVKRGYDRSGEWIKLGVKVINKTGLVINNVTVQIDEYPSALQYEEKGKKAVVDLQSINAGELQSAIFRFKPTRCVDGNLTGFVRYTDATGKKHTIDIKPVEVKSICPMLTSDGIDHEEIVNKLMEESLTCNKTFIEFDGSVRGVYDVVQARLGRLYLYDHDWSVTDSVRIGHLFYLGKTKYAKKYFAAEFLISGTSEDKGGITIAVHSDEPAILTGFFQEMVTDLENHITVLKETSDVCAVGCGKCGAPVDIDKVNENGYVKCDHCDFWNRIPKWKRRIDEGS